MIYDVIIFNVENDNRQAETKRVDRWLIEFNRSHPSWKKGDLESRILKTADLVNHDLRFAVELKSEGAGSVDKAENNIEVFSNRLEKWF